MAAPETVQWPTGIYPTAYGERLPNFLSPHVRSSHPNCSHCECTPAKACLLLLIYQLTSVCPDTQPSLPQGLRSCWYFLIGDCGMPPISSFSSLHLDSALPVSLPQIPQGISSGCPFLRLALKEPVPGLGPVL